LNIITCRLEYKHNLKVVNQFYGYEMSVFI
jgi:hypothetical protein